MKKILFPLLVASAIFASCKKDEDTTPTTGTSPATTKKTVISKDSTTENGINVLVRVFEYDSADRLVKIKFKDTTNTTYNRYDTVIYNSAGNVERIDNYSLGVQTGTISTMYSGNNVTQIASSVGDTLKITYVNDTISTLISAFGSSGGTITRDTLTAFGFDSKGNAISLNLRGTRVPSPFTSLNITTQANTSYNNPYYGNYINIEDWYDILNPNIFVSSYITEDPSKKSLERSYTFYANNFVKSYTTKKYDKSFALKSTTNTSVEYIEI